MAYTTIDKPTDYFNTVIYTGNGSTHSITGVGHQPDWLWIKCRSVNNGHALFDVQRTTYSLSTENNTAESDRSSDGFTSLDSDGFTLNGSGAGGRVNVSGRTYVSWNWSAGGTASSNTDGSITSNVSVNSTSGFSVVTYTGTGSTASIGHGLGAKPDLIISKNRSAGDWNLYHDSFALNERIKINSTGAKNTNTSIFSSLPTSSVVHVGNGGDINTSGGNHLFYCFKSVKGFSRFGSYVGNGSSDGSYIHLGFKPAFIMFKNASTTATNWVMKDNKRSGTSALQDFGQMNPNQTENPTANQSSAENKASAFATDILSNGFKLRGTDTSINASGDTYIYMAFAESPFVTSTGIPITAR